MNTILTITTRNAVLKSMARLVAHKSDMILAANALDMQLYQDDDLAMKDRLKVDQAKIVGMVASLEQLAAQEDPIGVERFRFTHQNGMQVYNKTASFGTILIIYESRPDVTVEAGGIAFKSGNKILLKGGKEALNSNLTIVALWHEALQENKVSAQWVEYLNYNRAETQSFLARPTQSVDLIVPRGGERLIAFVKTHASCPVIVSGRGNNFVYVHQDADSAIAMEVIINGKTDKISACNAVDKVIIDANFKEKEQFVALLLEKLKTHKVTVFGDEALTLHEAVIPIGDEAIWEEEFLDYKIVIGEIDGEKEAIAKINACSGGHSAAIVTKDARAADRFMTAVDCAAVYHNASTRFTDGFQLGLGGELAISTDKLHQRGPIGLQHLVTNKWYIHGNGQIR